MYLYTQVYYVSASRGATEMPNGSITNFKSLIVQLAFLVISIIIDSDRGHCWVHLKKTIKIEPVTCISMFVFAMNLI